MSLLSIPNYHGSLAYVTAAAGPEQAAASTTWFQRQREGCTGQKHTTTAFVFSVEAPTSSQEQPNVGRRFSTKYSQLSSMKRNEDVVGFGSFV